MVNREKSKIAHIHETKFLGMSIIDGKRVISGKSMKRAMEKVKELTPRGTHLPLEKTIEKINKWYVGWSGYYLMTQYPAQFRTVEARIRRRLRSCLISQQKRRRHLFAKLLKRGATRKGASIVFSNQGRWALSNTFVVASVFSVSCFIKQLGLKVRSTEKYPHWLSLDHFVKVS